MENLFIPQWQTPPSVRAFFTFRHGGVSDSPYHSFNLAANVGDDIGAVEENRLRLQQFLPNAPKWLRQGHTSRVVRAEDIETDATVADAVHTFTANVVCTITVADCLPILLCAADGDGVAAVHAGWRGLSDNIIEKTAAALRADGNRQKLMAWIGPAITAVHYEVGDDVRDALCRDAEDEQCFKSCGDNKYLADLPRLAARRLRDIHIPLSADNICTYANSKNFFSARRDGVKSGRMAAIIWFGDKS